MNLEEFRHALYPLGFIAAPSFTARTVLQWLISEKRKQTAVPKGYWYLSVFGNTLLCLHCFFQLQYPLALIQLLNALIAYRNLQLIRKDHKGSLKATILSMGLLSLFLTLTYIAYSLQSQNALVWTYPHAKQRGDLSAIWPIIGYGGTAIFASRFWLQWWQAEKSQASILSPAFFWCSLVGAIMALSYFLKTADPVNALGYSVGLIAYIRNLWFQRKKSRACGFSPSLFLFAGEQSADGRGSELMKAIQTKRLGLSLTGVGGPKMRALDLDCILPMEAFEVMGFTDVLSHLPQLIKHFRLVKRTILKTNPQAVVLIDYPDFNLRLAKALRKSGYRGKLIQYVSPTVWAWRKGRIETMEKNLDLLLCIFPFEPAVYQQSRLRVAYVGHPLLQACQKDASPLPRSGRLIGLFPGSRLSEIELNFPKMLQAADELKNAFPDLQFAVSLANAKTSARIRYYLDCRTDILYIPEEKTHALMQSCFAAIATSGTVTLELALYKVPTVVVYAIEPINAFIAKHLARINLPHYCIVNIILGKTVYPELIHKGYSAYTAQEALTYFLTHPSSIASIQEECDKLHTLLKPPKGGDTPSEAALTNILSCIGI